MRLIELVEHLVACGLAAELIGHDDDEIQQVASLATAGKEHLSFFTDPKRLNELEATQAGCVLLTQTFAEKTVQNRILVDNPYYAYACLAQKLNPRALNPGVAATAVIAETAQIGHAVEIQENVVIGEGAKVGDHCHIGAGSVIGENVVLGEGCYIYPNVTILQGSLLGADVSVESGTVIGGEGFGNANHQGRWTHIPQLGKVVIGAKTWIGNNCTIDRGALDDTVIGENCLIDNLVHIAHNVKIGEGSALAGQVGFAGSSSLGAHCTIGGQAGIAGHIHLADHTHYFAKTGVTHSVKEPGVYAGFPAVPVKEWQKTTVRMKGIDKLTQKIKALEKELSEIKDLLTESK